MLSSLMIQMNPMNFPAYVLRYSLGIEEKHHRWGEKGISDVVGAGGMRNQLIQI